MLRSKTKKYIAVAVAPKLQNTEESLAMTTSNMSNLQATG